MRNILLAAASLSMLFLASCQKELDDDNGGGGNNTPGTKLVKTVNISGQDSVQTLYSYNGAGKLSAYTLSGNSGGQPVDLRITLVRNASGIIQKQVTKSIELLAFGIDSILTEVTYDAAASRYKHAITEISLFGFTFSDSIVYNYDGAGKLTSQIDYFDDGSGLGYEPLTKIEFTYNGNNLASQKIYSYESTTSSYTLEDTYTFEYDAKINPMKFSEEAMILGMSQFYSANNITKTTLVSVANPPDNFVANITYTYNSVNRPVTGTEVNGGTTSVTTFTYQ